VIHQNTPHIIDLPELIVTYDRQVGGVLMLVGALVRAGQVRVEEG